MKKVLLIIAIIFTANTFASVKTANEKKVDLKENLEIIYSFNKEFKECEIKIKGTFDGKKINVVVKVETENCAKAAGSLLKGFTEKT